MTNEKQIAKALRSAPAPVLSWGPRRPSGQTPPKPDEVWQLPGGTAWVYYGEGNQGLFRPVLMADGFNTGPSTPEFLWDGLEFGGFPLLSELRRRRRDVILLGFDERSASLLDNAQAAIAAIHRALAERLGSERLVVGGFSMGGLVTRYALARMETQRIDHQTGLYWSYDTPHRGAWIPLSLQAFAHYARGYDSRFSDQINSPAARQLLWRHMEDWQGEPGVAPERTAFLRAMEEVGGWPRIPRLLGLANGTGTGADNGIKPGQSALMGAGELISGTDLRTQPAGGDSLAAILRLVSEERHELHVPSLPRLEGAPGGMLEGFGILADVLNSLAEYGLGVDVPIRSHCFVPAVSAVAVRDLDTDGDLYAVIDDLDPDQSELDDFILASRNEEHTKITEELCTWLLDRLP